MKNSEELKTFQCFIRVENDIIYDFTITAPNIYIANELLKRNISVMIEPINEC